MSGADIAVDVAVTCDPSVMLPAEARTEVPETVVAAVTVWETLATKALPAVPVLDAAPVATAVAVKVPAAMTLALLKAMVAEVVEGDVSEAVAAVGSSAVARSWTFAPVIVAAAMLPSPIVMAAFCGIAWATMAPVAAS